MTMTLRITNLGPAQYAARVSRGSAEVKTLEIGESVDVTCWKDGPLDIVETEGAGVPAVVDSEPIMRFFTFGHLPGNLAAVSRQFYEIAMRMLSELPPGAERTVTLRKLLEAKDAAVRAAA